MDPRAVFLLALALLLPVASADAESAGNDAEDTCALPPCGWILPILDIVIDDKLPCGGGKLIYAEGPPDDCFDALGPDEVRTYTGAFILKWEITDEGTYPKEIGTDIVISFGGTASNQRWLDMTVIGEGMTAGQYYLDDVALTHPDNLKTITDGQGQETLWFWFERPIEVTFTRVGDPDWPELDMIAQREGVLAHFIKARSTESGPRFKEGFGIEEMRFNACTDEAIARQVEPCPAVAGSPTGTPADQDVPGIGWMALLAMCVILARRQR